jgi:hypothetical protein
MGFYVTRLVKECRAHGQTGYERESPWTAMGFPCSGGGGRIEWKNFYTAPKLVSFSVSTDCPMAPANPQTIEQQGEQKLGLDHKAKLLAYTPMEVQYWEMDEFQEANTGSTVEFRTTHSLTEGWQKFRNNSPIRVRLYGRENAWVQGDHIFMVEGNLRQVAKTKFRFEVLVSKALDANEVATVKKRCEALRPRRACSDAF